MYGNMYGHALKLWQHVALWPIHREAKIFKSMQDCKHNYFDRRGYDYKK